MHVIGAGLGRTGTYSLKLAINRLGLGPCHHMEEVLLNAATQVPLWASALQGQPDWAAIYAGYASAVDWPTAGFFRELNAAYPDARFVLTIRDPERWADSFAATIYKLVATPELLPEAARPWHDMAAGVVARTGFPLGLDLPTLMQRHAAHVQAVRETIPAERLLVYEVRQGWEPLCAFLGRPVPDEPFPQTNHRAEFWDRVMGRA